MSWVGHILFVCHTASSPDLSFIDVEREPQQEKGLRLVTVIGPLWVCF